MRLIMQANFAIIVGFVVVASICCRGIEGAEVEGLNYVARVSNNSSQPTAPRSRHRHVWPGMKFGWKIVVGGIITIVSAALGSVGGAGGDGQFVPMLALVLGFDQKSAVAISKCMIFGGATTTVLYNVRQRCDGSPVIDYDLALLFQPLLILGISIGVALNVLLANWMITIVLIIVLLVASINSFLKGIRTWEKETQLQKEMTRVQPNSYTNDQEVEINSSNIQAQPMEPRTTKVSVLENVNWKDLGILLALWIVILALQIAKDKTTTCSLPYWLLNVSQMPATVGVTLYQAVRLYKGHRVIASKGVTSYKVKRLIAYCSLGILAGTISGLLGIGGGVMVVPLFLHLGIPPEVSSATTTLIMVFSSSMTVVEYYLLKQFPVPYALFFAALSGASALLGQAVIGKVIRRSGRRSMIIFALASLMVLSIAGTGGVGIARAIKKIRNNEYMSFENFCRNSA